MHLYNSYMQLFNKYNSYMHYGQSQQKHDFVFLHAQCHNLD